MRCATSQDCAATVALWEACGLTRPWNDAAADFHRAVNADMSDILCVEQDGEMIATIMVGYDGHRGWVYYLGVAPQNRKNGLGRKLMDAAEAWLTAREAPKIQLMVRDDNHQAIGFYTAIGYDVQPVVTIGRRL